ncbi:hypothetical protein LTS10_001613 [Elasticomyces elasticus]|nr:hypothetical protein LTS10_001613 [Elasticomyces elasticus]
MATLRRPALGQTVSIGALYNASRGQFLPDGLLNSSVPEAAFQVVDEDKVDITASHGDGYHQRFKTLDLPVGLAANLLTDSVRYGGASRYLAEPYDAHFVHSVLQHTFTKCVRTLDFHFRGLQDYLTTLSISNSDATHMVVGIEWGSQSIISLRVRSALAERTSTEHQLHADFDTFTTAARTLTGHDRPLTGDMPLIDPVLQADITAYSDMLEDANGILLKDFGEAYEFLRIMPLHVKSANGGKGWPMVYSLLPLDMVGFVLPVRIPQVRAPLDPAPDVFVSCFRLLDEYTECERRLGEYQYILLANSQCLLADRQFALRDRFRQLQDAKQCFTDDFKSTHLSTACGRSDPAALRQIADEYQNGERSPQQLGAFAMPSSEALAFMQDAISAGAIYIGHDGTTLKSVLPSHPQSEAYVFHFDTTAMEDDPSWKPNLDLLSDLLQNRSPDTVVAIMDSAATNDAGLSNQLRIALHQDGREIVSDLLAHRSSLANKCFARCDKHTLETEGIKPPIQRRHVTIACPGTKCSVAKVREWLCPHCMAPVEYGYTDQYFYCDCGRSFYSNFVFRCSSDMHGLDYMACDPQQLLRSLDGLVQTNYLNILILGETGVGKSTFINAMVNYLEFGTLDEAIDAEKLNYVIPCSFSTQIMDRTNPDRPIEEKRVKVGGRDDERDGSKGDSATQKTTVYPVTFRSGDTTHTVRLIDTPGIGDSRGVDVDRQNMADILSTLSGYDTVHGILILLKSNNARLTITFRYCIKELLTHLHHNAAANMAFGFTNTRISNYTPGDTYGPLKALLEQHPNDGLCLTTPTTYCFDSESFRYLAAYKNDVVMPNRLDFDRSWEHSREETLRLIDHFKAIPPHAVKSTISLNGARQLISELTKPIAEISQLITTNIQLVEDQVESLKDTRTKGDELRNMLHVQKVQMNAERLSQPRTVCSDQACTEVRDDGKGQNTLVIVYKQHCHPQCHLDDVQADVMAHPGLIRCAAFGQRQNCIQCGHHWQQHLHVLYELQAETVTVVDNGIQQQLTNHADDITLKQMALTQKEELIAEYRQEREIIRDAAAKFCVFLKNNSLAPYNDALIAYLDSLIKEEQAKVQAGGNGQRLHSLTLERKKHQEAIKIITRDMNSNASWDDLNEGGVDRLVQSLYNLKHFGDNLKNLRHGIVAAHEATYRERPYTVKRRNKPRGLSRFMDQRPAIQPRLYQPTMSSKEKGGRSQTRSRAKSGSSGGGFASMLRRGFGF